jgi:hypothetical protein
MPPAAWTHRLVASLAIIFLIACTMLAMDDIYMDTFRPAFFLQPSGIIEYIICSEQDSQNGDCVELLPTAANLLPPTTVNPFPNSTVGDLFEVNNFGSNMNVRLKVDRQREVLDSELKYILHWNEAYGDKLFGFGLGREPFYKHRCPETRCVTTDDRKVGNTNNFKRVLT